MMLKANSKIHYPTGWTLVCNGDNDYSFITTDKNPTWAPKKSSKITSYSAKPRKLDFSNTTCVQFRFHTNERFQDLDTPTKISMSLDQIYTVHLSLAIQMDDYRELSIRLKKTSPDESAKYLQLYNNLRVYLTKRCGYTTDVDSEDDDGSTDDIKLLLNRFTTFAYTNDSVRKIKTRLDRHQQYVILV